MLLFSGCYGYFYYYFYYYYSTACRSSKLLTGSKAPRDHPSFGTKKNRKGKWNGFIPADIYSFEKKSGNSRCWLQLMSQIGMRSVTFAHCVHYRVSLIKKKLFFTCQEGFWALMHTGFFSTHWQMPFSWVTWVKPIFTKGVALEYPQIPTFGMRSWGRSLIRMLFFGGHLASTSLNPIEISTMGCRCREMEFLRWTTGDSVNQHCMSSDIAPNCQIVFRISFRIIRYSTVAVPYGWDIVRSW